MLSDLSWYQRMGIGRPAPSAVPSVAPKFMMDPATGRVIQVGGAQVASQQQGAARYPTMPSPPGQIHAEDAIRSWRGSQEYQRTAEARKARKCPSCGSPNYFPQIMSTGEAGGAARLSMGRCMECGYRPGRDEYNANPTMQSTGSLRGIIQSGDKKVPVEQARSAEYAGLAEGGKVQIFAHYGG